MRGGQFSALASMTREVNMATKSRSWQGLEAQRRQRPWRCMASEQPTRGRTDASA